ncbi:MAG: hypothetical protein AB1679_02355 [Actinomycetota bacterium]
MTPTSLDTLLVDRVIGSPDIVDVLELDHEVVEVSGDVPGRA